jgi:hypothetical protein
VLELRKKTVFDVILLRKNTVFIVLELRKKAVFIVLELRKKPVFFVLELRKSLDLKPPPDSREVTMIVKASSTLTTIIQTFENRTTEQAEFENLLSGHFNLLLPFPLPPNPPPPPPNSPLFLPHHLHTDLCFGSGSVSNILFTSMGIRIDPDPGSQISANP